MRHCPICGSSDFYTHLSGYKAGKISGPLCRNCTREQRQQVRDARTRPGVYILRLTDMPIIKIGWTKDMTSRLQVIRSHCPFAVEVASFIETTDRNVERRLKESLREHRLRGEWFQIPDGVSFGQDFLWENAA